MRILITGGMGFLGGRVALYLQQAGHQIVLGSRNAIGPPLWLPKAEVSKINWDDGGALEQSCDGVDLVIQAAGMNAQDCAADPVAALEFNGLATARLLIAAVHAGVRRFMYVSTAHVYANPLVGTITEDTCPRNLHPYATSHIAGEHAVLRASQRDQITGFVIRLSNAFGPPIDKNVNCWNLLINDLCRQAVLTGKMVLQTSGLQQRDFVGMTEVCRVVDRLSSLPDDALQQGVFNVGSGISQSVLEIAQLIQQRCRRILGFEPELQRPEIGAIEQHGLLTYRPDRLAENGINIDPDNIAEIDSLIKFCRTSF